MKRNNPNYQLWRQRIPAVHKVYFMTERFLVGCIKDCTRFQLWAAIAQNCWPNIGAGACGHKHRHSVFRSLWHWTPCYAWQHSRSAVKYSVFSQCSRLCMPSTKVYGRFVSKSSSS
jgi:hypothetical protein